MKKFVLLLAVIAISLINVVEVHAISITLKTADIHLFQGLTSWQVTNSPPDNFHLYKQTSAREFVGLEQTTYETLTYDPDHYKVVTTILIIVQPTIVSESLERSRIGDKIAGDWIYEDWIYEPKTSYNSYYYQYKNTLVPIPEPTTIFLFGSGLLSIALVKRKNNY